MGDQPYQPTLLSLQDMLNLEEDDGDWGMSNNPYNISNVFESLLTPSTKTSVPDQRPEPTPPVYFDCGNIFGTETDIPNPYFSPIKQTEQPRSSEETGSCPGPSSLFQPKSEEIDVNEVLQFLDEENIELVNIKSEAPENNDGYVSPVNVQDTPEKILPGSPPESPQHFFMPKKSNIIEQSSPPKSPVRESVTPNSTREASPVPLPRLEVVTIQEEKAPKKVTVADKVEQSETGRRAKQDAIDKLDALIASLKRYSKVLGEFLDDDGFWVLERYGTQTLGDIFDGVEIQPEQPVRNPLHGVHAITRALINHAKGKTALASLPPQKTFDWKSSELLELQSLILESVIANREFMLNCRYTQLLTEMGFDAEDLEKLRKCETKQAELGQLKIILNDHNFYSKLKPNPKKPIKTIVLRNQPGTDRIPRVISLPKPEKLVEEKWKILQQIRWGTFLSNIEDKSIDWLYVMKKMYQKFPALILDEDTCKLAYDHYIRADVNKNPWTRDELLMLRYLRDKNKRVSWPEIANMLGTQRLPFSCFVKYKGHCISKETNWSVSRAAHRLITKYFYECGGNLYRMDCKLASTLRRKQFANWMAPRKLVVVCKKYFNPRHKKGRFSIVEDALLLVVMEKYKSYLLETDGKLDPVGYALPWRYISVWKARLGALLTQIRFALWSQDDDRLLCALTEEYGPNYKIIQRHFPLKDRKQCRDRYMRLQNIFKTMTLEDYHLLYKCRKKEIDLKRLKGIAECLEAAVRSKQSGNTKFIRYADLEFLKSRRPPSDSSLQNYLQTFSLDVMKQALIRLSNCLLQILGKVETHVGLFKGNIVKTEYTGVLKENNKMFNIDLSGFNRKIFDLACPASVASALQIRNATLVPLETIKDASPFERAIYHYYKYFDLRGKMKLITRRAGIPSLNELLQLPIVSRIVRPPDVVPVKPNKNDPCPPSLIVAGPDLSVPMTQDELVQVFEERKKGGRRKGAKRKKTSMREQKRMAAMTRWQKTKTVQGMEEGSTPSNSYESDFDFSYPATPSTPGSSLLGGEVETTSSSVMSGFSSGNLLRSAAMGLLSDHAYISPMTSPATYASLPLPQLFAKVSELQIKHENGPRLIHIKEEIE